MILYFDTKKQRNIWWIVFLSLMALIGIISFGGEYAFDLKGDEYDSFDENILFPMGFVIFAWIWWGPSLLRLFVKK